MRQIAKLKIIDNIAGIWCVLAFVVIPIHLFYESFEFYPNKVPMYDANGNELPGVWLEDLIAVSGVPALVWIVGRYPRIFASFSRLPLYAILLVVVDSIIAKLVYVIIH
jgi:hypothetical protein